MIRRPRRPERAPARHHLHVNPLTEKGGEEIAAIVQLVEMPWRGEVELAAELDDGAIVLVDRWYTDERRGHV
jgi:hypothetical protein